jgi:prepilin-type N-terminal cleavage/methylation domain-containing protein
VPGGATTTKRGFSLLEVLVAAALFLVTVTGVLSATSTATATYEHQRRLTQAMSVGEFVLEELLLRYTSAEELRLNATRSGDTVTAATPATRCVSAELQPSTSCTNDSIPPPRGFAGAIAGRVGATNAFGVNIVVTDIDDLPLRRVIVVVAWREAAGVRSLTLETYRP